MGVEAELFVTSVSLGAAALIVALRSTLPLVGRVRASITTVVVPPAVTATGRSTPADGDGGGRRRVVIQFRDDDGDRERPSDETWAGGSTNRDEVGAKSVRVAARSTNVRRAIPSGQGVRLDPAVRGTSRGRAWQRRCASGTSVMLRVDATSRPPRYVFTCTFFSSAGTAHASAASRR